MPVGKLVLCIALLAMPIAHGAIVFLVTGETLCDRSERVCLRATLLYDAGNNVLTLQARLTAPSAPGILTLRLRGTTPGGQPAVVDLRCEIRGRYSEIIDQKLIPPYPPETRWKVSGLYFQPR